MKCPQSVTFMFDPDNCDIPALSDFRGRILWACIKTGHITDQHFNDAVRDVAIRLNEKFPSNYQEFKDVIEVSGLHCFGTLLRNEPGFALAGHGRLDDEFWEGIWQYLIREKQLIINISIAGKRSV